MSEIKSETYHDQTVRSVELNGKKHYLLHDLAAVLGIRKPAEKFAQVSDSKPVYERVKDGKHSFMVRLISMEDTETFLNSIHTQEAVNLLEWIRKDHTADEKTASAVLATFLLFNLLFNPNVLFFPADLMNGKGKEHADR